MARAQKKSLDPGKKSLAAERFERKLKERIVGQDRAISRIARLYQVYLAGLYPPDRPIGNFLFLGPTGSGKTRIIEAASEILFGTSNAVLKIDCAEYAHSHEISRLIGSPPGYLGHRETTPYFSQGNLERYRTPELDLTFLLFDEIEKASDTLWSLLLGILDKGRLTLGDNTEVDMTRTVIFMTGNIGAGNIEKMIEGGIGFTETYRGGSPEQLDQRVYTTVMEAARRKFSPEFLNRIDNTVVFRNLTEDHVRRILDIELDSLRRRIMQAAGDVKFSFDVSARVKDLLIEEGYDQRYGARHLKRAIERFLVYPMANLVSTGQVRYGDHLLLNIRKKDGMVEFHKESSPELRVVGESVQAPS
ncbi:MAG: AAA family ATPase [Candidatus Krumholzibacteria bacterium]|jgi:ATP-dependent Clp protease ATP-binding subunit ClpA|nr:AAA family ATPase [Candidatus Krumholzibacteria bacterium]MDP6669487.1 AAA family ATPase [Candidatus Krumholzibacteria bacterium]MDP6797952.1 AAA family ATPase [Candidatus Krumholzibacteria bacterium]MDP7020854.1 AAA family ATPase [Candidatus Krumholzibacteria bacterium]